MATRDYLKFASLVFALAGAANAQIAVHPDQSHGTGLSVKLAEGGEGGIGKVAEGGEGGIAKEAAVHLRSNASIV